MTETRRIAYSLFAQTVLLLIVHAAVSLLSAVKYLGDDPLASSLPYQHVSAFANVLLSLAIWSGLLGAGIYAAASERPDFRLRDERLLHYTFILWTLLILGGFLAGVLGLLEGRYMLELPPALDVLLVIVVVLIEWVIVNSDSRRSPVIVVWTAAVTLSAACTALGLISTADYGLDRAFRGLAVNLNLYVAYPLAAAALGFWLIPRFSNAPPLWADTGVYTVGGLVALAGALVSLPPLYPLGASSTLGTVAVFFVPVVYLLFAAHSYRGLSDRNPTNTLAAHWYALGVLLLLLGIGLLGGLQSAPGIAQWTLGTRLTGLQAALASFGVVAVVLGVTNQAAAEMRGTNARVTGLMPFWLVAFGLVGGGLALAFAGVVQVYFERMSSVGYLETQRALIPLYALWVVSLLLAALGILIYALGFWARRPEARRVG